MRAICLLVEAIKLHTLQHDRDEYADFRSKVLVLEERLTPGMPKTELLVLVGGIIHLLQDHSRQTDSRIQAQFGELKTMIAGLTQTIGQMANTRETSLLHEIQLRILGAGNFRELRELKVRLSDCLATIASDGAANRKNTREWLRSGRELPRESGASQPKDGTDPVTGLPSRAAAEAALAQIALSGGPAVAVVFVARRLDQIGLRYGDGVAARILQQLAIFAGSELSPTGSLYRWRGSALLAVIPREMPLDRLRKQLQRMVATPPQCEVTGGGHDAIVSSPVEWATFPVTQPVEDLIRHFETFIGAQAGQEDGPGI